MGLVAKRGGWRAATRGRGDALRSCFTVDSTVRTAGTCFPSIATSSRSHCENAQPWVTRFIMQPCALQQGGSE